MSCSFCRKTASKLVTHSLCRCCSVHLKCYEATAKDPLAIISIPDDDASATKADCEFCLEKYQKNKSGEHRKVCRALLAFRCTVCNDDFVTQEGLWNHLDSHKIEDASKESYCQVTRVTYKLHQCVLCNNQRGYQESFYWKHVHEDHDGFYLKCSGCGDNFRSRKFMNDHTLNHCKAIVELALPTVDKKHNIIRLPCEIKAPPLDSYKDPSNCEKKDEVMEESNVDEQNCVDNSSSGSAETKCSHCDKVYRDEALLACHIEGVHLPYECKICGLIVPGRTRFSYHKLKYHTEEKYQCPHCDMKFHRNNNFQRHMSKHVDEKKFPCDLCGAKFKTLEHVTVHKKRNHKVRKQQPNPPKSNKKESSDDSSQHIVAEEEDLPTVYHCPSCNVKFDDEEVFSKHVREVHQLCVCTKCGSTFTDVDQLNEHKETYHPTIFTCSRCHEKFDNKTSYQDHLAEHNKKSNFQCELCDQQYENQSTLQSHMVSDHNAVMNPDGIQCTCPICGETISSIRLFRHHKLKFHTERQYQCPCCPRKFLTKSNYMSHIVAHKRGRIFSCRFCGMRYKRLHMLDAHMKLRHDRELEDAELSGQVINQDLVSRNIDPEDVDHDSSTNTHDEGNVDRLVQVKEEIVVEEVSIGPAALGSIECSQCHQLFSDADALLDHVKTSHQTNKCDICELEFENPSRLRYHKIVSHTEPRFECSYCAKKFHFRKVLAAHEWTHRKEDGAETLKPVVRIRFRSKFAKQKSKQAKSDQSTTFKCHQCSSKFLTEERLQRHIDNTHSRAVVQCTSCELTFSSRYKMTYHKIKVHTEAQHQCPHCDKKFHVKYRLQEHLVVHSNS